MSDPKKSDDYTEEDQTRRLEAALRGARIVGAPAKKVTRKKRKDQEAPDVGGHRNVLAK
jgi:hypothetical protein